MSEKTKKRFEKGPEVIVSELNGVRSLHLNGSMVQSSMRIAAPNELELVYTQCMMGFLLFYPKPEKILMIGLGGGSLVKFVYHHMPETRITVAEVNPQVIAAAYQYFELPQENDRFEIIVAEGGQFVVMQSISPDVIMVDGFDDDYQIPSLCSQEFYDQTRQMLNKNGMLVVNLLSRDKQVKTLLQRIERSFNGHLIAMMTEIRGNLIVFAFKNNPGKFSWKSIRKTANKLEKQYPLPFAEFVSKLQKYS
ncbi:polyamine aminopropyltransferase [Nitrosomonas sp.]|uniref:polyamine aminopropyltransferase n=1 Tax=Nitrosomonas sp. TaxID=42353 RepID=UPI002845C588|nr:polyamine aminopropyltransferase [Nitrosomonas sp.]MDR4514066.1 polyamine aminopropyltransferase [Nitrosomonas sp.]